LQALNWYSYYYDPKKSHKWLSDYMKTDYTKDKIAFVLNGNKVTGTMCALARMASRGAINTGIDDKLKEILKGYKKPKKVKEAKTPTKNNKIKKVNSVIANFDDVLDAFYRNDYKAIPFISNEVLNAATATDLNAGLAYYTDLRNEVATEKEGYEYLTSAKKKKYLELLDFILTMINSRISTKKVVKVTTTRKKKQPSIDKQLAKLRYKSGDVELDIVSMEPFKIFDCKTLWVYDTSKRKLIRYTTEDKFTVSGTTLSGFTEAVSENIEKTKRTIERTFCRYKSSYK
jgi:hypothetical protein